MLGKFCAYLKELNYEIKNWGKMVIYKILSKNHFFFKVVQLQMNDQIEPSIPQIILDDFKIKKLIGKGSFSHIFSAENKKTKKEVAIKAYIYSEDTSVIRGINVSCVNIPGLVKTIGYRKPIKNNDKELSRWKKFTLKSEAGESSQHDLSGWIVIMEYYKNNDLLTLTRNYLQSRNIDSMNPTIRSKIIFGVASIMKQLHQNNAI